MGTGTFAPAVPPWFKVGFVEDKPYLGVAIHSSLRRRQCDGISFRFLLRFHFIPTVVLCSHAASVTVPSLVEWRERDGRMGVPTLC